MLDFGKVIGILEDVLVASGMNAKINILMLHKDDEDLKKVLYAIYNPFSKTGISDAKLDKAIAEMKAIGYGTGDSISPFYTDDIIEYFQRNQTGRHKDVMLGATYVLQHMLMSGPYSMEANVARGIVTNDLQIGVSVTTFNKVFGKDFIPKISCMLGKPYEDVAASRAGVQWPCVVTEKLDGVRRILIKQGGACRMYSRSGHEDTGLTEILEEATNFLPDNHVYDGELLAEGVFKDNIALRQATNAIAAKKGHRTGLVFNVFDMMTVDEFFGREQSKDAYTRKVILACTFGDRDSVKVLSDVEKGPDEDTIKGLYTERYIGLTLKHIKPVPVLGYAMSLNTALDIAQFIWRNGGEGVMLNTTNGLYEQKRSNALVKVKHVEEHLLKVIGLEEGSGKFTGMLGALVLEYGDYTVKVGTGFTDAQREFFWNNPEDIVGRYAEIECFGESSNKQGGNSLSCPVFKRMKGDKE